MAHASPSIALLHHQYGPYHVARARALQCRLTTPVHFVQLASHEGLREWHAGPAPAIHTLCEGVLEEQAPRSLARLASELFDRLRPQVVVIAGYSHPAMRAAARWCRRHGAAAIMLSDSHHADRPRHKLKELAKRAWVSRNFDAVFTAGALSAAYARSLGFSASQIWRGYDVVDNAFFAASATAARPQRATILAEFGLPERVFIYVGRLSPEKNLHGLLDAMAEYRRQAGSQAWGLLLLGGGPQRDELESRARSMSGSVALGAFRQLEDLGEIYGAASALILPSTSEPWGLVVNEAMAASLPVLVSERAGSAADLVFPGVNGYVFNPNDKADIVSAMSRISSGQIDLEAMGNASERIIANFTPETWATALIDAVEVTLARRARGR